MQRFLNMAAAFRLNKENHWSVLLQENIPPDLKSIRLRQTESMLEKIERGGRMEFAGPLGDSLSRRRRDAKEISRFSHDLFKCYLNVTRKYIRWYKKSALQKWKMLSGRWSLLILLARGFLPVGLIILFTSVEISKKGKVFVKARTLPQTKGSFWSLQSSLFPLLSRRSIFHGVSQSSNSFPFNTSTAL